MRTFILNILLFISTITNLKCEIITQLENYFPGQNFSNIKEKSILFSKKNNISTYQLKLIKDKLYAIDVFLKLSGNNDEIRSVYFRFPHSLSHDTILKELHSRFKKQDEYAQKNNSALYKFNNREKWDILYQGNCAITCYPMFLELTLTTEGNKFSLIKELSFPD